MQMKFPSPARTVILRIGVYVALLASNVLFYRLRANADDTGIPLERNALPAFDRAIGLGATPGQRLQSLFFTGHATLFDTFWAFTYESWLFVPTIVSLYIIIFRWDRVRSYLPVRLAAYFVPLIIFFLMPAAPPWMTGHGVRITSLVTGVARIDPNQAAAFPSLHVVLPATLAYWLWLNGLRRPAVLFTLYTSLIIFAVLYLGEHYFVDVAAGLILAVAIVHVCAWVERSLAPLMSSWGDRTYRNPSMHPTPVTCLWMPSAPHRSRINRALTRSSWYCSHRAKLT